MSASIPVADRPAYKAWVAWRDAGGLLAKRPKIVTAYLKAHHKIPPQWWALYAYEKHGVATPPTSPIVPDNFYEYSCIMAQEPLEALKAPAKYKIWFSADPKYDEYATVDAAKQCRGAGHEVGVWFVPTQVSYERAHIVAERLNTPHIMGECESSEMFDESRAMGLIVMVGSLSGLAEDRRDKPNGLCWYDEKDLPHSRKQMIADKEVSILLEHYWNLQPALLLDFMQLPVSSVIIAVYDGHSEIEDLPAAWLPHVKEYMATPGHFVEGTGVYGPGMTDDDWKALP